MEKLKELLTSLLGNRLDRVTILSNLKRLKVGFDEDADFVVLKYRLQLVVLESLLKRTDLSDLDSLNYTRVKKETEDVLEFHRQKEDNRKFHCCLVGCLFRCTRHRDYIRHIKRVHNNRDSSVVCQFGWVCKRTFTSVNLLQEHIDHVHAGTRSSRVEVAPMDIPCKCSMVKCFGTCFQNISSLMLHLRNEHDGEVVECIFDDCDKRYSNAYGLKNHFYQKHTRIANNSNLKTAHKLVQNTSGLELFSNTELDEIESELPSEVVEESPFREDSFEDESIEDAEKDFDEVFLMAYCDFLNRLATIQFIPQSTINLIGDEYLKNYSKSNEVKSENLRKSLKKIPGISDSEIQRVLDDFQNNDPFLAAQTKLDTEFKRNKFVRDSFTYVAPVEIVMNSKQVKEENAPKAVIHYVPVIDSFKNLVQDPSFNEMVEKNQVSDDSELGLRDVKDGWLYKNNKFFLENPGAYTMMLYSDAIELVNPLGAGRGKHKVIQIFFSLCEIPKHQRSKIDRIQLVAVFKEKLIKRFGIKKIYKKLIEDLKMLEAGVTVFYPVQRLVKCGVLLHPADNLEAHMVGGFSQSFSSKDICRMCHIKHPDLLENIHNYGSEPHAKWTVEEYDRAATIVENKSTHHQEDSLDDEDSSEGEANSDEEEIEDENDEVQLYGIKHRCPLNSLEAFHSTSGFPPDILHDVFEGLVSQDLLGIIRILSLHNWFSIEEYNNCLQGLSYKFHESNDRPQNVPTLKKTKKLLGKACSIWIHMRNFPLIIRRFVLDKDDPILILGLKLHEITERLTASEFKDYEIDVLEDKIVDYLDERKNVFDEYPALIGTPKPKTHYISHYPEAIRLYGPPMSYWTARYESRHRIAKNTAESSKNFKNISLTVSTRQQMRSSSVFYHGMFATSDLVISDKTSFKSNLKVVTDFDKAILPYMSEHDFLCSEIEVRSQQYKKGQVVVLEMFSPDEIRVGVIISVLVKTKSTHFVTMEYLARRKDLQYFEAKSKDPTMSLCDVNKIVDYKPLTNHGTSEQLFFCLHHHISYSYD